MNDVERQSEIDQNLEYFVKELPRIPASNTGKFALLRRREIKGYYDTALDAVKTGNSLYPDKLFSIQQVTTAMVDLGYYSHAVPVGAAQ